MRIIFFKRAFFFLFFFTLFGLTCQAQIVTKTFVGTGSSWNTAANWSPAGVPTKNDAVIIPAGKIIIVDVAIANCYSINFTTGGVLSSLTIDGTNILNVVQNIDIQDGDSNSLAVKDGTLNVGGDVLIYGNGNKHGELTVASGHVNVVGNFGFTFGGNGNDGKKIVAITNGGSIVIGGIFTNPSTGTIDPVTLANTYIKPSFRSLTNGNWNVSSNWQILKDDGTYVTSPAIPTDIATKIEIRSGHTITLSTSSPAKNLIVNGILDCNSYFVTGPGPFSLNSGATLITSDANGIVAAGASGSIQVDGTRSFSSDANYTYSGSVNQCTGTGLPSTLNGILTIDKTTPSLTVTICHAVLATKLVNVNKGNLISNGNLTLQSTATSYAQIGRLDYPDAKVSGPVNVQSFFTGSPTDKQSLINRGNRMISVPVIDAGTPTIYQQLKEKMVITGPKTSLVGTFNGFDLGGTAQPYAITLSTYSEPASMLNSFIPVPTITTRSVPGQATFLFFRGNNTANLLNKVNSPYAFPEDVVVNYKGIINQGPIAIEIKKTITDTNDLYNGINAVGNPYPGTLDWDLMWATNSALVENEIRILKAGGGFVTRKKLSNGTVAAINGETIASQYIQPGQGFYVKKTNAGLDDFKFLESHKSVLNMGTRLLSIPTNNILATHLVEGQRVTDHKQSDKFLRINIEQEELKDETLIVFNDAFNPEYDYNDAIYFTGNSLLLGSLSKDGKITSINAMPDIKNIEELRLYVNANSNGVYRVNFTDLSGVKGYQVFLKDNIYPEKINDVKKQNYYEFSIDKANLATYGSGRLSLLFRPEPISPPSLFTARKIKSVVQLNWQSATPIDISYFEVEGSTDRNVFQNLGKINNSTVGSISSKYSFIDKAPAQGLNYYRIKQFNKNGTISYTEIRIVDLSIKEVDVSQQINIYPNPSNDIINVEYSPEESVEGIIFDPQGKIIWKKTFSISEKINFNIREFAQGIYFLELKKLGSKKLIGRSKFVVGI